MPARATLSLIALLAALGLGLKLLAASGLAAQPGPLKPDLADVVAALERDGFTAAANPERPFVTARRGNCALKVRLIDPMGTHAAAMRVRDHRFGPIRYAWRGAWYAERPHSGPLLRYYLAREFARIGVRLRVPPVLQVASRGGCEALDARWSMALQG